MHGPQDIRVDVGVCGVHTQDHMGSRSRRPVHLPEHSENKLLDLVRAPCRRPTHEDNVAGSRVKHGAITAHEEASVISDDELRELLRELQVVTDEGHVREICPLGTS